MQNHSENLSKEKAIEKVNDDLVVKSEQDAIQTNDSPQNEKKKVVRASRSEFFSGPIPPPELLAKYDEIIPNGADRIVKLTENQQSHRHYLEKAVIDSDIKRSNTGLIFGFCLALFFGCGGIYLIAQGYSANGLAVIFLPLAGLVGGVYSC